MNKLLLVLTLATTISLAFDAHSSELERMADIYYGSRVIFVKDMPLDQGEEVFGFHGKRCSLELDKPVKGKMHIPKGEVLVIEEIYTKESRTFKYIGKKSGLGFNPATITLRFENTDSYITCDTDDDFSLTIESFNKNGTMKVVQQEQSKPFTFK
ncbi:MAG: hypothetical protein ACJAT2_002890 [Bacteriovoracaceae bacterium]|jgi:hypothetical protein